MLSQAIYGGTSGARGQAEDATKVIKLYPIV